MSVILASARNRVISVPMTRQTVITKKKRGPKPTGVGTLIGVRVHETDLQAIDEWARRQEDKPSRPEAIRRLARKALDKR